VVSKSARSFDADLSHETLNVTNLKAARPGFLVNLERPLRLADRIDGHLVQGHVDGVGRVQKIRKAGASWEIGIAYPKSLSRYLVPKGSVTVDGISMTVNRLTPRSFTLVVIPHTFQATNLKAKRAGDRVNLEVDMMGKYIESLSKYGRKKT
jgi:riboflavin synthase